MVGILWDSRPYSIQVHEKINAVPEDELWAGQFEEALKGSLSWGRIETGQGITRAWYAFQTSG